VSTRTCRCLIACYVLTAVVTFGHAMVFVKQPTGMSEADRFVLPSFSSALCAVLWPFYWSTKLFQQFEPQ
jgi:hypothetical protein